jgi:MFS superfamily sulfate permease-like transporter
MTTVTTMQRWMKHREKQGVWHVAHKPPHHGDEGIDRGVYVTACRGDMLFGSIGPIVQQFEGLPKSPKCVRCIQIFLDSEKNQDMRAKVDAMPYGEKP